MASRRVDVGGVDTFLYDAGHGDVPVVCLHGNPDSADLWLPLLGRAAQLGRVIAPDLPGWGRSPVPDRARCDGSVGALDQWFEGLLDELGLDRFSLVVHDWGGLALAAASRRADRLERLVVVDAVPLTDQYRWHAVARLLWRRPVLGRVSRPLHRPATVALGARLQQPGRTPMPAWRRDLEVAWGSGTADSILRLYRSADARELGRLGERLGDIDCPALFVRGQADPYIGAADMEHLASRLAGPVESWEVPGAGHWVMYDDPAVVDRIVAFLTAQGRPAR